MTIFAIINNLIDTPDDMIPVAPVWTLVSASSIIQGGNPYFVPDFADSFEMRMALAVKIGKLGKGVSARFAHRYISGVAPCLMMVAADKLRQLKSEGLPWTQAISYDRSTVLGQFTEMSTERIAKCSIDVLLKSSDRAEMLEWQAGCMSCSIEETIECISRDNTLKTGDIIIAGVADEGPELHPGMRVRIALDGVSSPSFNIR